jgi:hypothetical protein
MKTTPKTNPVPTTELAADFAGVLVSLTAAHEELLELVREHRRAISTSDAAAIQECLSRQGMLAVRVTELERSRQRLSAALIGRPKASIAELTANLPAESRTPITTAAERLGAVLTIIQRENGVVRAATQTLIAHIDGLMQQVARALSHAGTYGRQGRVEGVGPVPCGIDMVH